MLTRLDYTAHWDARHVLALTYAEKISEAEAWVLISDYNQVTCLHTDGDKDKMLVRVRKICVVFFNLVAMIRHVSQSQR